MIPNSRYFLPKIEKKNILRKSQPPPEQTGFKEES